MRKSYATVYRRQNRIVIYPNHLTQPGFLVSDEPYYAVQNPCDPNEIGQTLRKALKASRLEIPTPIDYKKLSKDRWTACGVKSETQFMKGSVIVSIEQIEGKIVLQPYRNGGTTGDDKGFHELFGQEASIPRDKSDSELGHAVLSALSKCI